MQNVVCMCGRMVKDAELRTFDNGGTVANFPIAVQRNYKNANGEYDSDFFNCQARGNTGELIIKYFGKGDFIPIVGALRTRKFVTNSGENRTTIFIDVIDVTFTGSKKTTTTLQPEQLPPLPNVLDFPEVAADTDDDLPF